MRQNCSQNTFGRQARAKQLIGHVTCVAMRHRDLSATKQIKIVFRSRILDCTIQLNNKNLSKKHLLDLICYSSNLL